MLYCVAEYSTMEGVTGFMQQLSWSDNILASLQDKETRTARWTSSAYAVQFGQIEIVAQDDTLHQSFGLSAWGLSEGLKSLLMDYSEQELKQAISWLTIQQNAYVVMMLEDVALAAEAEITVPDIDELFLTIDAELYLPRGLRMIVTCVTNIITASAPESGLEKFVAVIDPGESQVYIQERRGMNLPHTTSQIQ